jgi:ribosome-associated protein
MVAANTERPSKSARKRQHLALQDLGEALTRLRPSELHALPLDERLMDAVLEARGMYSRGALRRQRQLIGKLMRDADAAAIRAALGRLGQGDREATRLFHAAESWRDRICSEGAPAIDTFAADTDADAAALHRLANELAASGDEDRRRSLKRKIFREVHAGLARAAEADSG